MSEAVEGRERGLQEAQQVTASGRRSSELRGCWREGCSGSPTAPGWPWRRLLTQDGDGPWTALLCSRPATSSSSCSKSKFCGGGSGEAWPGRTCPGGPQPCPLGP